MSLAAEEASILYFESMMEIVDQIHDKDTNTRKS